VHEERIYVATLNFDHDKGQDCVRPLSEHLIRSKKKLSSDKEVEGVSDGLVSMPTFIVGMRCNNRLTELPVFDQQ
jgi:hypothetical protein